MTVDGVVGLQRGDEGKGRITDALAQSGEYSIVARGNGGSNAGHSVYIDGVGLLKLHQIPSGIACEDVTNVIGGGTFVDPVRLDDEIGQLRNMGVEIDTNNLLISHAAQLVLPHHILLDEVRENGPEPQQTTKSGISFAAADKARREGVRAEIINSYSEDELFELAADGLCKVIDGNNSEEITKYIAKKTNKETGEYISESALAFAKNSLSLQPHISDTATLVNERLQNGDRILAEGAQAYWLDLNHGMYPEVTSSPTAIGGILDGLGVAPHYVGAVHGVAKLVKSHVGGGPLVTEIEDEDLATQIRGREGEVDSEYGTTTGRKRRIGYFDLVELRNAVETNGMTYKRNGQSSGELSINKMDHAQRYGRSMLVAVAYELDGEITHRAPASAMDLNRCTPVYEEFETWGNLAGIDNYDDLPPEAKKFIRFVEEKLDVPVTQLGTGPERSQVIYRPRAA